MMITVFISFYLFVIVKTSNDGLQVQTEKIGENVTIKCEESFIKDHQYSFAWFKQSYGKLPQLVVRLVNNNLNVRHNRQFQQRFNATLKGDQLVLNIQETVEEDSGTYFCVRVKTDVTEFGSGTLLIFNEEKSQKGTVTELKVKSGKSAGSLQCSVLMATLSCSGDHSVYWFRPDSGEPRPGIIFTHGNSSSPCTRSSETVSPTQSCIYKLPKNNLSLSDAGTYYCAVAACGETTLEDCSSSKIKGDCTGQMIILIWLSIVRTAVVAVMLFIIAVIYSVKKIKK
uniref:Ig-like domain-containing protein n=2 Tax=Astyanax mexicanus TaxID=7994 RepID=A0A3B1JIY5_ASTMX